MFWRHHDVILLHAVGFIVHARGRDRNQTNLLPCAVLANELRKRLDALLETKIERPDADISNSPVVEAILRLINTDGI